MELGVQLGDDGLVLPGNRYHAELLEFFRLHHLHEILELEVQHGGVLVQLENGYLQLAPRESHRLGGRAVLQGGDNLLGCALFGVEHQVYAHLLEQELVLRGEVVLVVHAGDDLSGPEPLCEQGADYVDLLVDVGVDGYEQVSLRHSGLPEHRDAGRVAVDRAHVGIRGKG